VVDVDLIDARGVHGSDRPSDAMFANSFRQNFTAVGEQELGIPQTADTVFGTQNYRGSDHGTEQGAASDFVDSRYHPGTHGPCALFEFQRAAQALEEAKLDGRCRKRFCFGGHSG